MSNEQLVMHIKAGENVRENMEQLYLQVRAFICSLARKYKGAEIEDLEQEGYLVLYPAIEGYEPDQGVKFLTYAGYYIRQRLQRYQQMNGSRLRRSSGCLEEIRRYERFCNAFRVENGDSPPDEIAAYFLEISLEQVREIQRSAALGNVSSLDSPIQGAEDEEITLGDTVASAENPEESVLEEVQQEALKRELWACVDSLPEKQQKVLKMHYQNDMSLSMIGREQETTPEAVRQIHAKALRELRKPRYSKRLRPFLGEEEKIYSMGLACGGLAYFEQTWTSSTERAALKAVNKHGRKGILAPVQVNR